MVWGSGGIARRILNLVIKRRSVVSVTSWQLHQINPLNAELNPICHLLALLGAHHILHISRIRVKKIS